MLLRPGTPQGTPHEIVCRIQASCRWAALVSPTLHQCLSNAQQRPSQVCIAFISHNSA